MNARTCIFETGFRYAISTPCRLKAGTRSRGMQTLTCDALVWLSTPLPALSPAFHSLSAASSKSKRHVSLVQLFVQAAPSEDYLMVHFSEMCCNCSHNRTHKITSIRVSEGHDHSEHHENQILGGRSAPQLRTAPDHHTDSRGALLLTLDPSFLPFCTDNAPLSGRVGYLREYRRSYGVRRIYSLASDRFRQ